MGDQLGSGTPHESDGAGGESGGGVLNEQQAAPHGEGGQSVKANDEQSSAHVEDKHPDAGTPLTEGISEDVAPAVEEFMEQAAQQNEAAASEVPFRSRAAKSPGLTSRLSMCTSRLAILSC